MRTALDPLAGVPFHKGHGTGNDFILITDAAGQLPITAGTVVAACDRHFGIGADGLIRAIKSAAIPDGAAVLAADPAAEWFMDYFNADGSLAQMCGNGVRVFVEYLIQTGALTLDAGARLAIGTRDGVKYVTRVEGGFAVDMGSWRLAEPALAESNGSDCTVKAAGVHVARPGLSIDMGNPHTVVALAEELQLAELNLLAAPLVEPAPEHGSNVEFALPRDPLVLDGVAEISMRVHERGSGETLSCGTGACAAAAATRFWAGQGAPDRWSVNVPGGTVAVRFFAASDGTEHVELAGPAVVVATGQFQHS